jgi:hypothetical protein
MFLSSRDFAITVGAGAVGGRVVSNHAFALFQLQHIAVDALKNWKTVTSPGSGYGLGRPDGAVFIN